MKDYSTPQVIAEVQVADNKANDNFAVGDRIVEIIVTKDKDGHFEGTLDLEINGYPKPSQSLILRLPLPELMQAIAIATLNRVDIS